MARKTIDRRTVIGAAALASLPFAPALAQNRPIKFGLLAAKTGPLAESGIDMEQGMTVFLKDRQQTIAGRKIELIVADTAGNPATARARTQELVEREHVDLLFGPVAAFELLAINDYVAQAKLPILSMAAADDVTQRKPNPWFLRPTTSSSQACHVMAHYAASELKYKRMIAMADDFAFGYEEVGGFLRVFEDEGGRIVKKIWTPLGTADYTPFLAQLGGADAVFSGFGGTTARFTRQYADFGLNAKMPLVGGMTAMDDSHLKSMGDEALGVIAAGCYTAAIDTPTNRRLIAGMARDYGTAPGTYAACMWISGMCAAAALEQTGGSTGDGAALMAAMRSISLADTPRGPVRFDHLGNSVGTIYITKVVQKDGKLANEIIKTYDNVSQFWTYDEAWFLAQPVYSRDYPQSKYSG